MVVAVMVVAIMVVAVMVIVLSSWFVVVIVEAH